MVESRWNGQTRHHEAKVVREVFTNALRKSPLLSTDLGESVIAKWTYNWTQRFGDVGEAWIEIPDERIVRANNPTGHAVLCWSSSYPDLNGVFCFIPFHAALGDVSRRVT
jgi:hypothetical protein